MTREFLDALAVVSSEVASHKYEKIDPVFEETIIAQLANIDGIEEYLRKTMANDMHRHFNNEDPRTKENAKGGFLRTAYLLDAILRLRLTKKD